MNTFLLVGCSGGSSSGSLSNETAPSNAPKLLSITPLTKTVALGATLSLAASGGDEPYSFDVYYGNGSITSSSAIGTYQAPNSEGSAVVRVQDTSGNTGYASIEIINAPVIQPTSKILAVNNKFPFAVLSGKAPYTFFIVSGEGTINSTTGEFTAGADVGAVVVRVADADGRTADANITVNAALSFTTKNAYVEKTNTYSLATTGGVAPYTYSMASGTGAVDKNTGVFTAPNALGVSAVQVVDALGNFDLAFLNITSALAISPASALVAKNASLSFTTTGGIPPYSYAVQTGGVGSISALTGQYTAPTGTGTATVRVTDSLGQTSDSTVSITNNLSFSAANLILAVGNTFDISTIVNGGVSPLTYTVASSHGLFAGSTYTAPNTPGVYDITVYDSQTPTANSVTTKVLVNSALILLPTSANVAVNAQKSFSASGGVPPYTYSVQSGGGNIVDGLFTAPDTSGNVVLLVTDARGNTSTSSVTVQAMLAIVPTTKTLSSNEGFTFTATGGNTPYAFSLVSGSGAINSSTGLYTAPGSSGLATVRVEDAAGNRKDALITILNPLNITPPTISLIKNGAITFTASGGAGPYSFSIASGEGTVNATTGVFSAPAAAGTSTVRVTDSLGSIKDATVTIYDGLSISPFMKSLAVNQTFTFTANGGLAPYTYSLVSGVGSISSAGAYSSSTAGAAIVRVTDAGGNTSDATISVNSALAINPTSKTLGVNNQFTFSATGGVPPYAFSVLSGGGTITVAGDYKAPATSANVVVRVTDSDSSTADATVTVNEALTISPTNTTLAAGGTQNFITAGGVGPYVYSVVSGGGSFTSSTYTAAAIASGASVNILVTDILGNTANASITINPITVTIGSPNNSDLITASNKANFTVSGTCSESGQAVNVSTTGGVTATPNCAGGVWTTNLNLTAVADGAVTITTTHTNINAVAATPATVTLTKDGSNPTVTITTPTGGSYIGASVTITGTCTKQGPINITLTGGISANTTCENNSYTKTIDLSTAADGSLTINAAHTDNAGNAATPATASITKDTVTPAITAFTVTNTSPTNSTTYNLTFTASDSPTQYCILENSTTIASCSWQNAPLATSFTVGSVNNDKTLSAWVRDAAGNTSARADSNMVHLDTVVATIEISVPAASTYINAASNIGAYTASGSCNKEGGTVTVKAGVTSVGIASCTSNTWTVAANFTSITDGSIALTAVLTDLTATNTTSSVVSITKDVIVPTVGTFSITNSSPSSTASYNLTFSATDTPSHYCILENSTTIGNCTWTSTPLPTSFTVGSTQNAKVLSAWVKDLAGNISTRADSNSVTLNTATPDAPSALSLATPGTSPNNITTPIIEVAGVSVGDTVSIYTDSSCAGGNLKGSAAVTTGTTVTVTSSVLTDNTYTFYAKTVNSASTASSCSNANVSYTLDTAAPTAGTISVNGGAAYATSTTVPLTLGATGASQMYITNTAGCASGGTYETYATSKASWTLATANATNTVYAKFKDAAGNESSCVNNSILHDDTGPSAPTSLTLGSVPSSDVTTPTLSWTAATDSGGSGVDSYQVQVYNLTTGSITAWTTSTSGSALTGSAGMLVNNGTYYMKVRAIDTAGNIGTESTASANWIAIVGISCPTGYIAVPALSGYTSTDFCVAKYEMKNNSGAKSEAAGTPWTTIARGTAATTANSAWKTCKDLGTGYDLISNAQWQTIARNIADQDANWSGGAAYSGLLSRGHTDNNPTNSLAASSDDDPYSGTSNTNSDAWNGGTYAAGDEQKRTHILSNGNVIWDFAGNVWEWVRDNNSSSQGIDGYISTFNSGDSRQIKFGNDTFCASPSTTPYCNMGHAWANYSAGAISRGGDLNDTVAAGIFSTDLLRGPTWTHASIGFRCVYTPNSITYYYTGAEQTFTVPTGVTSLTVEAWGAGGGGGAIYSTISNGTGGGGAFVTKTLTVSAGQSLALIVGGGGGAATLIYASGGGGGYSGIFNNSVSFANALMTAGGGGGGGTSTDTNLFSAGGAGGLPGGSAIDAGGAGGTISLGGAGFVGVRTAGSGSALTGGNGAGFDANEAPTASGGYGGGGAGCYNSGSKICGGGGGGGYYGGGGGSNNGFTVAGGGGGGSCYPSNATITGGNGGTPGGTSELNYLSGIGVGGAAGTPPSTSGGNGMIVISW